MSEHSPKEIAWQCVVIIYWIAVLAGVGLLFIAPFIGAITLVVLGFLFRGWWRASHRTMELPLGAAPAWGAGHGEAAPEPAEWVDDAPPSGALALLQMATARLTELSLTQWRALQHQADRQSPGGELGYLIQVLRVSAAVPFLTRMSSISSRWNGLFQPGGVARGQQAAAAWALQEAVSTHAFLSQLYLDRIEFLLKQNHQKEARSLKRIARLPAWQDQLAAAEGKLRQWHSYFRQPLGGLDALFDHYREALNALPPPGQR